MKYSLIIKPEAETDIRDIFEWYESKVPGLGEYFLSDLEEKFEKVILEPKGYQFHHQNFRFAFLKKFPVSIHFKIEGNRVYVFGVLSTSANPGKWRNA
ncbi:ParE-like toxin of type II ParDE toxin-antitoxin system [Algoriphagus boseongensis]|uniref:ParE-like toxin of type II ParDE toxin-antitoxin system n=1 Tax=Algoriphagus boseongensis TaxID=1442587 RepID=A0A4R6T6E1_9BACT|nr:type II toxin-antitoxin system RelE/ParE family toxin [Algoriphagus boseongensis]TDQ18520.1 ParE-like toxin of type II ParDE toxin-antitoxin system [Algoriphagus boseongensis]